MAGSSTSRTFVASVNDDGVVAFQATLSDAHGGVFTSDGKSISDVAVTASAACPARLFSSHPDINQAGLLVVYGTLKSGDDALLLMHPDGSTAATDARDLFRGIGPLGPTMNEHGDVAVRGTSQHGRACIRVWRDAQFHAVAEAGDRFCGFSKVYPWSTTTGMSCSGRFCPMISKGSSSIGVSTAPPSH